MSKKSNIPRRKRFRKEARLKSAKTWIQTYTGKSIITGYAKWYGVDKFCAIKELRLLGIIIPESLEHQFKTSIQAEIEQKKKRKESKELVKEPIYGIDFDEYCSVIMGFTSGGASYGISHDEVFSEDIEFEDFEEDENLF